MRVTTPLARIHPRWTTCNEKTFYFRHHREYSARSFQFLSERVQFTPASRDPRQLLHTHTRPTTSNFTIHTPQWSQGPPTTVDCIGASHTAIRLAGLLASAAQGRRATAADSVRQNGFSTQGTGKRREHVRISDVGRQCALGDAHMPPRLDEGDPAFLDQAPREANARPEHFVRGGAPMPPAIAPGGAEQTRPTADEVRPRPGKRGRAESGHGPDSNRGFHIGANPSATSWAAERLMARRIVLTQRPASPPLFKGWRLRAPAQVEPVAAPGWPLHP